MKVLSLKQPWAAAVVHGFKTWETRSWATKFRGEVFIHSSKGFGSKELAATQEPTFQKYFKGKDLPFYYGAIIGKARIVDCLPVHEFHSLAHREDWSIEKYADATGFGDYTPGRFAWKLEDAQVFDKPIYCKGNLGLWNIDENLIKGIQVLETLTELTKFPKIVKGGVAA